MACTRHHHETCRDAPGNAKGLSARPSGNLQSRAGDKQAHPSYETPETTLPSSPGRRGTYAAHRGRREARRKIGIALPELVGVGRGSVIGAGIKVHQAGAIKPGEESSSEPREGAGHTVSTHHPEHDKPLLFPLHLHRGARKGSEMLQSPRNTPAASTTARTQEPTRQSVPLPRADGCP